MAAKQLNINDATREELEQLTDIGPQRAALIIRTRDEVGHITESIFRCLDIPYHVKERIIREGELVFEPIRGSESMDFQTFCKKMTSGFNNFRKDFNRVSDEVQGIRTELQGVKVNLENEIKNVKVELNATIKTEVAAVRLDLTKQMETMKDELHLRIDGVAAEVHETQVGLAYLHGKMERKSSRSSQSSKSGSASEGEGGAMPVFLRKLKSGQLKKINTDQAKKQSQKPKEGQTVSTFEGASSLSDQNKPDLMGFDRNKPLVGPEEKSVVNEREPVPSFSDLRLTKAELSSFERGYLTRQRVEESTEKPLNETDSVLMDRDMVADYSPYRGVSQGERPGYQRESKQEKGDQSDKVVTKSKQSTRASYPFVTQNQEPEWTGLNLNPQQLAKSESIMDSPVPQNLPSYFYPEPMPYYMKSTPYPVRPTIPFPPPVITNQQPLVQIPPLVPVNPATQNQQQPGAPHVRPHPIPNTQTTQSVQKQQIRTTDQKQLAKQQAQSVVTSSHNQKAEVEQTKSVDQHVPMPRSENMCGVNKPVIKPPQKAPVTYGTTHTENP